MRYNYYFSSKIKKRFSFCRVSGFWYNQKPCRDPNKFFLSINKFRYLLSYSLWSYIHWIPIHNLIVLDQPCFHKERARYFNLFLPLLYIFLILVLSPSKSPFLPIFSFIVFLENFYLETSFFVSFLSFHANITFLCVTQRVLAQQQQLFDL